jgi:hypothetical protein
MRRRLVLSVLLAATALGLAGCYYGPAYPAYGDPYYEPGYYYGPPVYGSVVIGGGGYHHYHRRW